MTNIKWIWNGKAKWQAGGKVTQVIARLIPLGIRMSDRPSDSQTTEENTSLISPHLLYKIIFLSRQSLGRINTSETLSSTNKLVIMIRNISPHLSQRLLQINHITFLSGQSDNRKAAVGMTFVKNTQKLSTIAMETYIGIFYSVRGKAMRLRWGDG
jgi:hypothetical protein